MEVQDSYPDKPASRAKDITTVTESSKSIAVTQPTAFSAFVQKMSMTASVDAAEPGNNPGLTANTVQRIITAETEAEMWDAGDLVNVGGRNLVDVEQTIHSFLVKYSSTGATPDGEEIQSAFVDSEGRGMYLLVNAAKLESGEEIVWNTSAPDIVSKLFWLDEHGKLPADVVIRGIPLGGGKTYLRLKPVPKRVIKQK